MFGARGLGLGFGLFVLGSLYNQLPSNTGTMSTPPTTTTPSLLKTCCDWLLRLLPPSYRRPLIDNRGEQYRELAVAEQQQQQQQQLSSRARLEALLPYARAPAEELHPPYPLDGAATMSVSVEALICEARMLHKPS